MASMGSFIWTVVLMLLLMYCVAVYFTELVAGLHIDGNEAKDPETLDLLEQHWGSITTSVFSLLMAISGGDDWRNLVDPLESYSMYTTCAVVFSCYIAFATLVMLNLVTGVFVEGAHRIIKMDKDSELAKIAARQFARWDLDVDGELTFEEFVEKTADGGLEDFFKVLGLTLQDAEAIFHFFDTDDSGTITVKEFLSATLQLPRPCRFYDLQKVAYSLKTQNEQHMETVGAQMESIDASLTRIVAALGDGGVVSPTAARGRMPTVTKAASVPAVARGQPEKMACEEV
jgi:hypothetical protein